MKNLIESIKQFLEMAKERNLDVNGSPEDLRFVINGLKLDSRFNVPQTNVTIKIRPRFNDALILIPEDVVIRPDAGISPDFIIPINYPVGWKCIFPDTFVDVNGEITELVFSVAGVLANLSLYNLVSQKPITKPAEVVSVEVTHVPEERAENSSLTSVEQEKRKWD